MIRALTFTAALLVASQPALAQNAPSNSLRVQGTPQGAGDPLQIRSAGGATSIASTQVAVGTTATQVAPARAGRTQIIVTVDAAVRCAFGPAGVTLATGFPLQPVAGATLTLSASAAVFGVCATAATNVGYIEAFN